MAKKLPKVSVHERRLENPFGESSVSITLKTPGQWKCRIVNRNVRTGHLHKMTSRMGWTFVAPEELPSAPEDLGFRVLDGRVVMGEHAEEVLMKKPKAEYDQIQRAKGEYNLKQLGSKQTREAITQATAQQFGDQAAETVHSSITVKDGRESSELDDVPA